MFPLDRYITWAREQGAPKACPSPSMDSDPSTFYSSELRRALREQSFGIAGYAVSGSMNSLEATASITLLEGRVVNVALSSRGYYVSTPSVDLVLLSLTNAPRQLCGSPRSSGPPRTQCYESIEGLLQSVSGLYEKRRQEVLVGRLERLS